MAFWSRSSFTSADQRDHDLGNDLQAFLVDWQAASMMARACISVISGYVMPRRSRDGRASD